VLIELFSLGVTAEALRASIGSKSAISFKRGPVDPKFQPSEFHMKIIDVITSSLLLILPEISAKFPEILNLRKIYNPIIVIDFR